MINLQELALASVVLIWETVFCSRHWTRSATIHMPQTLHMLDTLLTVQILHKGHATQTFHAVHVAHTLHTVRTSHTTRDVGVNAESEEGGPRFQS